MTTQTAVPVITPDTYTADGFSVDLLQIADCYFGRVRRDDGHCGAWERIDGQARQHMMQTWGKTRLPLVRIYHEMCR